ncbi:hypothetical protein [Burkholderia sp. B21-007]|uniref:hypothetical protein n=1 Tax=unclassified Burkholderia TaxID=2613784 RepID=UPI003A5CE2A2
MPTTITQQQVPEAREIIPAPEACETRTGTIVVRHNWQWTLFQKTRTFSRVIKQRSTTPGDFPTRMKTAPEKEKALISQGFFFSYLEARAGVEPA